MTDNAPTQPAPSSEVFISYASQDAAVANAIVEALENRGIKCWIAPRDVTPGAFYADEIVEAINASRVLVVVLTQNAVASTHVLREVERASAKRHPVVSLRMDAAPLPTGLEYFLSASHWLDATASGINAVLPKLADAVRRLIAPPPAAGVSQTGDSSKGAGDPFPQRPTSGTTGRRSSSLLIAGGAVVVLAVAFLVVNKVWHSKEVVSVKAGAAPLSPIAPVESATSDKSIAVLPFVDMSEKHDQEYFSDGLSEELIDMLAKSPDLRVPARTSSFFFKGKQATIAEIAKALSVTHVLEGSVRKSGKTLRIAAQLIRVDNGYHVWSETYDRDLKDVFKVQDEIAAAVVKALESKILAARVESKIHRTISPDAYNQYLLGRQFLLRYNPDDAKRAATAFRRVIGIDPQYAPGWAELSDALFWMFDAEASVAARQADEREGCNAADKAVALQPDLAQGYVSRSLWVCSVDYGLARNLADSRHALDLDPDNVDALVTYAEFSIARVHIDEAEALLHRVISRDPLNARAWSDLGLAYDFGGQWSAAREAYRRSLEISPVQYYTVMGLCRIDVEDGHPEKALECLRLLPSDSVSYRSFIAAMAHHDLGHVAQSQQWLERVPKTVGAMQLAELYAWRGDADHAMEWLNRARTQRDAGIVYVRHPTFNKLRRDPRYIAFVRELGLLD